MDGLPIIHSALTLIFRLGRYGETPSKTPMTQSQTSVSSNPFGGKASERTYGNAIDITIGMETPETMHATKSNLGSQVWVLGRASKSTMPAGIASAQDPMVSKKTSKTNGVSPSSTPGIEPAEVVTRRAADYSLAIGLKPNGTHFVFS